MGENRTLVTEQALQPARIIWDYHQLRHQPVRADAILALGTNDLRVAEYAAQLWHQGFGAWLICSGGIAHQGDLLATQWTRPEAEMYAEVAERAGVPRDRIILETEAKNTAENFRFTRALLQRRGVSPRNLVIAVKPFMQRRAWATLAVEWPEIPASVASPLVTLDEYFTADLTPDRIINIMMGDLQRIWIYARKGWSAPQRIPSEVLEAFDTLKGMGFTKHLLPDQEGPQ